MAVIVCVALGYLVLLWSPDHDRHLTFRSPTKMILNGEFVMLGVRIFTPSVFIRIM